MTQVNTFVFSVFFQGLVWHYSDSNSSAVVQYVGIKIVRFSIVNGQAAASSCLPLCISLWHLCTADCFLSISPGVVSAIMFIAFLIVT